MSNVSMVDGHIDRPMTNYERIKNMSVEEMVDFLESVDVCCDLCTRQYEEVCLTPDCKYRIKQWLESEVETE